MIVVKEKSDEIEDPDHTFSPVPATGRGSTFRQASWKLRKDLLISWMDRKKSESYKDRSVIKWHSIKITKIRHGYSLQT